MQKCAVISFALAFAGCSIMAPSVETIRKMNNTDNSTVLTLVRLNYHATTPYVYKVFVAPESSVIEYTGELDIIRLDDADGLEIKWIDNDTLDIRCVKGRVFKFNNFVYVGTRSVKINLNTRCGADS